MDDAVFLVVYIGTFVVASGWAMLTSIKFSDAYGLRYGGLLRPREGFERLLTEPFFAFTPTAVRNLIASSRAIRTPANDPEMEALRRRARRARRIQLLWMFLGWIPVAAVVSTLHLPTELDPAVGAWLDRYVPVLFYAGMVVGWIALIVYWLRRPARWWWWVVRLIGLAYFAMYMLSLATRAPR